MTATLGPFAPFYEQLVLQLGAEDTWSRKNGLAHGSCGLLPEYRMQYRVHITSSLKPTHCYSTIDIDESYHLPITFEVVVRNNGEKNTGGRGG
jgi:hypothetical protein